MIFFIFSALLEIVAVGGLEPMPMITLLIPPSSLNYVENELLSAGLRDLTISESVGYGRAQSLVPGFTGGPDILDILPTARIEFAVSNDECQPTIDAIIRGAQLDKAGQGTIIVSYLGYTAKMLGGRRIDDSSEISAVPHTDVDSSDGEIV